MSENKNPVRESLEGLFEGLVNLFELKTYKKFLGVENKPENFATTVKFNGENLAKISVEGKNSTVVYSYLVVMSSKVKIYKEGSKPVEISKERSAKISENAFGLMRLFEGQGLKLFSYYVEFTKETGLFSVILNTGQGRLVFNF